MTATTINVDTVATHDELADEVGGHEVLSRLLAKSADSDTKTVRRLALEAVMKSFGRRTPPILAEDLADVTELRDAVVWGAAMRTYRNAMTSGDDTALWTKKYEIYRELFGDELAYLMPTVNSEIRVARSVSVERR